MKTIVVERVVHLDERRLKLVFGYDDELIALVKGIDGRQWSASMKCWHIPDDRAQVAMLLKLFSGKAWIDYSACRTDTPLPETEVSSKPGPVVPDAGAGDISLVNALKEWMEHKRYSPSTIRSYCGAIMVFIRFLKPKELKQASNDDVIRFTQDHILANRLSHAYQNQFINALKLFFKHVLKSGIEVEQVERPRREHPLPNVLSMEEVKSILQAPVNLKHRAMLSLIYACGLRRSELLNLKPSDVDSRRGLLIIRNAKGRKDRVAPLGETIIALLREYYSLFKPENWLFEGQVKGDRYTETSLQAVFKSALGKAGIRKKATPHWLRHSYATHLLESGTDLRYIQEILGHKSSRTTEIYTHVSARNIQKIKSPFDAM